MVAAESHRIRGRDLTQARSGGHGAAEEAYRTAIAIAQQQKAQSFELRAAVSLARSGATRASRGNSRTARSSLRVVHGRLDTPDLKDAQALVDESRLKTNFRNGL